MACGQENNSKRVHFYGKLKVASYRIFKFIYFDSPLFAIARPWAKQGSRTISVNKAISSNLQDILSYSQARMN